MTIQELIDTLVKFDSSLIVRVFDDIDYFDLKLADIEIRTDWRDSSMYLSIQYSE